MDYYSIFAKISDETEAYTVGSLLEKMNPVPVGIGILEVEDQTGFWEISGFFSQEPNLVQIKIIETVCKIKFVVSKLDNKDWVSQVQRDLKPVKAGRFVLHGKHVIETIPINLIRLRIEAAMAFGTGHHASTVGCLLALEHLVKQNFHFHNILDIGCGTGVLAMASASVFRARVLATDVDEIAVATAVSNFEVNGFSAKIRVAQSWGFNSFKIRQQGPFDLVFANILAKPLCMLASDMATHTKPDALVILSGILKWQANRVECYYLKNKFSRVMMRSIDQWTTIIMRKM